MKVKINYSVYRDFNNPSLRTLIYRQSAKDKKFAEKQYEYSVENYPENRYVLVQEIYQTEDDMKFLPDEPTNIKILKSNVA